MIRVCATSDLHGHLPAIPECDLLLLVGDLCPHGFADQDGKALPGCSIRTELSFQRHWVATHLNPWLKDVRDSSGCREILATWGNHDFIGEDWGLVDHIECTILNDAMHEFEGYTIYGTPWVGMFDYCGPLGRPWAFM